LTRAWQIAGARSIVASQLLVSDESTRVLMLAFHRGVQAGLAKDEAMRKAMGELRKTKRWEHPFYWAPFLLLGDPRPGNGGRGYRAAPGRVRVPENGAGGG